MSSDDDNDENAFVEIRKYFSKSNWNEIYKYERNSFLRAKENYEQMKLAGLNPKPPAFMRGRVYNWDEPKKSIKPVTKKSRKRRAGPHQVSSSEEEDGHGLDWAPSADEDDCEEGKPRRSRTKSDKVSRSSAAKTSSSAAGSGKAPAKTVPAPAVAAVPPPGPAASIRSPESAEDGAEGTAPRSRYPKRAGSRKQYTEAPVPDDDDYLSCDDCGSRLEGDCPTHGPLAVIADTEVPVGEEDRARRTVPRQLAVLPSKITGAGEGVWARELIPRRVRFGPYEGDVTPASWESGYGWEVRAEGKPTHCVDAVNPLTSNWMRFVNCPRNAGEENLRPYQYQGKLYYRTTTDIPAHTELLVWYGDSYAKELGIDPKEFKVPADPRALVAVFKCEECGLGLISPLLLHQHHRAGVCSAERSRRKAGGSDGDAAPRPARTALADVDPNQPPRRAPRAADADPNRKHRCATCGVSFTRSDHLRRHQRTHTGERPYACATCGASFTESGVLRRHQRTHTGERPYACATCGASFTESGHLRTHQRTHTGERPYACATCGASFTVSGNLRRHQRRCHPPVRAATCSPPATPGGPAAPRQPAAPAAS